jgi:hypothetical protein
MGQGGRALMERGFDQRIVIDAYRDAMDRVTGDRASR